MHFFSTVVNLVRRTHLNSGFSSKKDKPVGPEKQSVTAIITEGTFRSPVLWKTADGKWHRHQLHIFQEDHCYWYSLTRNGVEMALHNSSQLMYSTFDSSKKSVHLIFVSGVLSLRFPSQIHTEQYFAWTTGAAIRSMGSIFPAKIIRSLDGTRSARKVLLITKDSSLVMMDTNRCTPLFFTTTQLIRAVTVRGHGLALLSAIPGNDYFLECDQAKDVRSWYEANTVKKQRQKLLSRKVSKPRSRIGKPKMGVLAIRRRKASLSLTSFEVLHRPVQV